MKDGPLMWHAHEILFGFIGSAIGGFLLKAVANWTGRPPIQGVQLFTLVVCWLAARGVMAYDPGIPILVMVIDASYWFLLTGLMGREILLAKTIEI